LVAIDEIGRAPMSAERKKTSNEARERAVLRLGRIAFSVVFFIGFVGMVRFFPPLSPGSIEICSLLKGIQAPGP